MGPLTTRRIPARASTGTLSIAWAMIRSMRARSSGSSSWPKSCGVPSVAQCVHGDS